MPDIPAHDDRDGTERKIGIGELDVIQGTGTLRTLLGSCIGLVLHDRKQCVGGLAHIVLPTSNGETRLPGKFADTALPELLRLIQRAGGKPGNLTAKIAGGANMFATTKMAGIGDQNLTMVERLLKDARIPVVGRHCGGQQGRRVAYDVQTGSVIVEIVGCPPVEL
ncbi:chemotaxis protein CheD [Schlesneria paludicola]|uniref:chemotaxis protein CheD n=1 Tax=Schlesneria paludicola TaxID=360056 RepID=UPI00029B472E|nr:chemotaxis protein CheD [Schlesneria paludicola]